MPYRSNKPRSFPAKKLNTNIRALEECSVDRALEIIDSFCDALEDQQIQDRNEIARLFPNILSKLFFRGYPTDDAISDSLQDCVTTIIDTKDPVLIESGFFRLERVFHASPTRHIQFLEDLIDSSKHGQQTYDAVLLSFAKCAGRISRFAAEANSNSLNGKRLELLEILLRDCVENPDPEIRAELASNIYFVKDASNDLSAICDDLISTLNSDDKAFVRSKLHRGYTEFKAFDDKRAKGLLRVRTLS